MTPYEEGRAAARNHTDPAVPYYHTTHSAQQWVTGFRDQMRYMRRLADIRLRADHVKAKEFHRSVMVRDFYEWA